MEPVDFKLAAMNQEPHVVIEAAVTAFNKQIEESEQLADELEVLKSQLAGYKRQVAKQTDQILELKEVDAKSQADLERSEVALKQALKEAQKHAATQRELIHCKNQLSELQKQWREANPKKLQAQIKRTKESKEKFEARCKKLETEAQEYKKEIAHHKDRVNTATNKVIELSKKLAFTHGTGLYHNDNDHLIYWPQQTKMEREDGSTYTSTSLLYMHQSGRGAIISQDPELGGAQMCAAPRGGLKPKQSTLEFASNWLMKVNDLQGGEVREEDMIPVNHNPEFEQAS
ncbi:hypothetical protein [Pseudoalteromonas peptidolytica]|uniref:Uncharacterized protein n=1 Tax=Pseudoalteromonas peptidolytica F12-50-A1 TaxID=1315280 RepID=A0A8I0N0C5_9GAMM|nr:hypothetical protein [Pseudoalteromonas peptidolytica]MBE0348254.1 hypothetical protein [Pseudoalteromonas peptidolytica F12-50-A1]NLR16542.1 hypothetical protein [Pseudoalteromonas peptidolytica]GEK08908.1 hypothetical protein PPE03_11570 [Pseudoalteromonas peptidolytica]